MLDGKLLLIKSVHSLIFWFQTACLTYILYAGITRTLGSILLIPVGSILLNGLLLLLNKGRCPFTTLAERQGAEKGSVTDIFLPDWMAHNLFRVSSVVFSVELMLLAVRYFTGL